MSTSSYKYSSRYNVLDTSDDLPENQPRKPNSLLWDGIICLCRLTCSSRLRIMVTTLALLCFYVASQNSHAIIRMLDNQSPQMAHRQSYGYINEPKWKWRSRMEFYKKIHKSQKSIQPPQNHFKIPRWYDSFVQVDFICTKETKLLDDDERWWICNPHHLQKKHPCIVYASGPPDQTFHREKALQTLLPTCEVHVFDPSKTIDLVQTNYTSQNGIFLHPWGFAGSTRETLTGNNQTIQLMTIKDTMERLGHKSVDLLMLDCAGCEWVLSYKNIGQLLVLMNGAKDVEWFSNRTDENFVLFHKEPVTKDGIQGKSQALSFLRVRQSFFPAALRLLVN